MFMTFLLCWCPVVYFSWSSILSSSFPCLDHHLAQDEDYGEFIGGGGVGSGACSLSYPLCNGSVLTATANLQPVQQQHPQQEAQQQPASLPPASLPPASLPLASLPVDDKYGTNVRSFFCSSDSSTGKLPAVVSSTLLATYFHLLGVVDIVVDIFNPVLDVFCCLA